MSSSAPWRRGEVVAWRDDGVARLPRRPGRVAPMVLAATVATALTGMTSYDTLCSTHRSWVVLLGVLGFLGTAAAIVGLVQARVLAPLFTVFVALIGVSIGLIDAVHDPNRGRLIVLGFGTTAALAALLTARAVPLALGDRRLHRRRGTAREPATADASDPPLVVDGESTPTAPG